MTMRVNGLSELRTDRLPALDALRGVLMVLMALDHASLLVRGVHSYEAWSQPAPSYPDAASFWTRFVTHLCAPGFFFLMGTGMTLRGARHQDRLRLVLRGVLLVVLEQLVVDPVLFGRPRWSEFGVLSALGTAMVIGAALVGVRPRALAMASGLLVVLCQLPPCLASGDAILPLWVHLLFLPGGRGEWFVLYPLLPWLGVVLLGMAFGHLASTQPSRAWRLAGTAGTCGLAAFVLLRAAISRSDWSGFLSLVKYPPALDFLLLAIGTDAILLWALSRASTHRLGPLLAFGQSALPFYLLHWRILEAVAPLFPRGQLGPMYGAWVLAILLMYPLCIGWHHLRSTLARDSLLRLL